MGEDIINEVLEYLKKAGPTNTFRLASVMGVDRAKLLSLLNKLEEIQAIRFEYGNAIFIKFVSEEKPKSADIEKPSPRQEQKIKRKLPELKETVRELEKKASARPKAITRTIIKNVPVTKTIIKKVPVIKTVVKRIFVHHSPILSKKEKRNKETPKPKKKFKLFTFMKNIKKLKEPEFVK